MPEFVLRVSVYFLGALWAVSTPAIASITIIADSSTVIPTGEFAGQKLGEFTSSGVVDAPVFDAGSVEFIGAPQNNAAYNAVFTWNTSSNTGIRVLADPLTPRPGSSTAFQSFRYASTNNGQFSFSSYDGIYTTVNGVLTQVIGPNSGFSGSSGPVSDGSNVWFYGESPNDGIFDWNNGVLKKVVSQGQATPSSPGYFFQILNSNVAAANGQVVFYGDSGPFSGSYFDSGVYSYSSLTGVQRIADQTTVSPSGQGTFNSFSNFPFATGKLVTLFTASDTVSGWQIDADESGIVKTLVANGQRLPDGTIASLEEYFSTNYSIDAENPQNIALEISTSIGSAIYIDLDGQFGNLKRVIGVGDSFLGSTISSISMSEQAYSSNQIAFYAALKNGTQGIYIISVPEPGSMISLISVINIVLLGRFRGAAQFPICPHPKAPI